MIECGYLTEFIYTTLIIGSCFLGYCADFLVYKFRSGWRSFLVQFLEELGCVDVDLVTFCSNRINYYLPLMLQSLPKVDVFLY